MTADKDTAQKSIEQGLAALLTQTGKELVLRTPDGEKAPEELHDYFRSMLAQLKELVVGKHDRLTCAEFRTRLFEK